MKTDNAHLRSFRILAAPGQAGLVRALLEAEGYAFEPEPFSPLCWRLTCEPAPLGGSLAAFFGYVYIQDRSSMLPPLALAPEEGATVVDMCSSPGSKTGFLAQLVGRSGFVLANELSHSRLATLRMTLQTGNAVQVGTCSYSADRLPLRPGSCRHIQLDPPCSGWGTVEKHPKVFEIWREEKVKPLISLQRAMLARAAELLVPGGTVVYSTCTTNSDENEHQVAWAENELGLVRVPLTPFPGFCWDERAGAEGTLRVDGERSQAQGFYIARLSKPADAPAPAADDTAPRMLTGGAGLSREALACATVDPALVPDGGIGVFSGVVRFLPRAAAQFLPEGFVWQGAPLGRVKGGGFQSEARLRAFMAPNAQSLVLESVAEVRRLLTGAAWKTDLKGKDAGLWLGGLPLGRVSLRSGRVIASFGRA